MANTLYIHTKIQNKYCSPRRVAIEIIGRNLAIQAQVTVLYSRDGCLDCSSAQDDGNRLEGTIGRMSRLPHVTHPIMVGGNQILK
jgi:hypothetical protein